MDINTLKIELIKLIIEIDDIDFLEKLYEQACQYLEEEKQAEKDNA